MQIVIDIPDEQVKKSLEESKYIHEDEGEKGYVHISMLYTNTQLEFVDIERKTDFYSCEYKPLPKGHGRLIDGDELSDFFKNVRSNLKPSDYTSAIELYTRDVMLLNTQQFVDASPTIIEADKRLRNRKRNGAG